MNFHWFQLIRFSIKHHQEEFYRADPKFAIVCFEKSPKTRWGLMTNSSRRLKMSCLLTQTTAN